jgi:hypothetical protein
MRPNNPPGDHHFWPVFYLSRWQRGDGPLVEFARRGNGKIEGRDCYPKGTGYRPRLYSNQHQPDLAKAAELETGFMQVLDRRASAVLELMENGAEFEWTPEQRTDWSRLIMSLLQRVPEEVEIYKNLYAEFFNKVNSREEERYKAIRWDGLPETLAEFLEQQKIISESASLNLLAKLMDHPGLGQVVNNMVWTTFRTKDARYELLTSDRPVLTSITLGQPEAYIVLPVGPRCVFAATKDEETMARLRNKSQDQLVHAINSQVVAHAVKFAYGSNYSQLRFVQNRLSTVKFESLFSRLGRVMRNNHPPDAVIS